MENRTNATSQNQVTLMESTLVAAFALASMTFTMKLNVPPVVGLPEITPVVLFSFKPAGRPLN
jgi:hypothetical protein